MATIQPKISRGHKYWYIVESRRVNGKPRPIVLAYLGRAEDLLRRLRGISEGVKVKSYSHGAVAALLQVAQKLEVPSIINKYVKSIRLYMASKPIRNELTVGMTLFLGAIGRVCMPTSKRGWWKWAKTTSCEYLLRCALGKIDSQHFWDLMDALPMETIPMIESELLQQVKVHYDLEANTLFYDTTNFFTFIATANHKCIIAQRGKNKQKRNDLRQVGLALVVTRKEGIPLFHLTYQGNRNDSKVFHEIIKSIKERIICLGLEMENHTLVFDRGNNSKRNLAIMGVLGIHYVGALTPYHHSKLLDEATGHYQPVAVDGESLDVYRTKTKIWGEERTVLVFVSGRLKSGQIRGIYQNLKKKETELKKIQQTLLCSRGRVQDKAALENKIANIIKGQFIDDIIQWSLVEECDGQLRLDFFIDERRLLSLEEELGFRILITDRHNWDTADIIKAFYGQANIEKAFKNLKNPHHFTLKPQFHWTDQKITVHYFICVLGYLLSSLLAYEVRSKVHFRGGPDSLIDTLNNIRLSTIIEQPLERRGRLKAKYLLEEMSEEENTLMSVLGISEFHIKRPKIDGVSVYN